MDVKLTDEQRKAIEGLFPVDEDKIKFTPDYYKKVNIPEELIPTFIVRPYNQSEKARFKKIQNKAMTQASRTFKTMPQDKQISPEEIGLLVYEGLDHEELKSLVRGCIVGIENWVSSGLTEIVYKGDKNGICKEQFNKLHDKVVDEIGGYLNKISGLLDIEALSLE